MDPVFPSHTNALVCAQNRKILLPRAKDARPILPVELNKMGARVDEVIAYQTIRDNSGADLLVQRLADQTVDMVTFTSSSTVQNFKSLLPEDRFRHLIDNVTIACIGPVTAETAAKHGFEVHITADPYTIPGLCEAILEHSQRR